jgi:divalent metal cation (Fe/Co/Zn/Cd) transporter
LEGRVHDQVLEAIPTDELRAAVNVSIASIVWTMVASSASIVLGVTAGSVVLIAFGATGLLDAAGSVSLVVHFRHAQHHEAFSERHERVALQVVTLGLAAVGGVTLLASAQRLATHTESSTSALGTAIAAASILVLGALSVRKHQLARRIASRPLHADGWLSATGCLLAVVTVTGSILAAQFDWWWADPAAAALIGCAAVVVALAMRRTSDA